MGQQIISITDQAAEQIKILLAKRDTSSFAIRIGVKSGGCSGLSYYLEYADDKKPYDELIESKGIRLLIDPKALMYLINSEMDYLQSTFKSGFVFANPNEKNKCGCGKSFSV